MPGIDIPCPKCGEKHSVLLSQAKADKQFEFACPACGANVTVNNEMPATLKKIENQVGDMLRNAFKGNKNITITKK